MRRQMLPGLDGLGSNIRLPQAHPRLGDWLVYVATSLTWPGRTLTVSGQRCHHIVGKVGAVSASELNASR